MIIRNILCLINITSCVFLATCSEDETRFILRVPVDRFGGGNDVLQAAGVNRGESV